MSEIIIGKIPGYNSNNLVENKDFYNNRLLSGITRVILEPTGYNFNSELLTKPTTGTGTLFEIGPNIKGSLKNSVTGTQLEDITAVTNWNNIVSNNSNAYSGGLKLGTYEKLILLCTNESIVNESINNDFGDNWLGSILEGKSDLINKIKQTGQGISSAVTGFNSLSATQALDWLAKPTQDGDGSNMLSVLAGTALGINMSIPQVWKNSSYNSNLQMMIKLISPSGDEKDVRENIIKPLMLLILTGSPMTKDGILYGYPTLWNIKAEGLMHMKLAAVENIIITRGGTDTVFNKYHQPLHIDVRMVFKPIINGFAAPADEKAVQKAKDGNIMMTNPYELGKSLEKSVVNTLAKPQTLASVNIV